MSHLSREVHRILLGHQGKTTDEQRELLINHFMNLAEVSRERLLGDPVYREAINEVDRRAKMAARREASGQLHSPIGKRGSHYRRIIKIRSWPPIGSQAETHCRLLGIPGMEIQFHATKGWRTYRRAIA